MASQSDTSCGATCTLTHVSIELHEWTCNSALYITGTNGPATWHPSITEKNNANLVIIGYSTKGQVTDSNGIRQCMQLNKDQRA